MRSRGAFSPRFSTSLDARAHEATGGAHYRSSASVHRHGTGARHRTAVCSADGDASTASPRRMYRTHFV